MKRRVMVRWCAAVAFALAPSTATADQTHPGAGGSVAAASAGATGDGPSGRHGDGERLDVAQMTPGRTISVSEHFARLLPNQCSYEATVTGELQEWLPREGTPRTSTAGRYWFTSLLTVSANVDCADTSAGLMTVGGVRHHALTGRELELAVGARARVLNVTPAGTCLYSPTFRIANGRLFATGVTQQCVQAAAGGGGPRDGPSNGLPHSQH